MTGTLRAAGFRITPQRREVLRILAKGGKHPDAGRIIDPEGAALGPDVDPHSTIREEDEDERRREVSGNGEDWGSRRRREQVES